MPPTTLTPGSRLGPYEIVAPLGAGGMGEVYRARDTRLDRIVAIKVLPADFASDPQSRARFDREARAISQLTHPHICTLYDVGVEGETPYLVMELLQGQTLAERLKKGALPLDEALTIATQIADALSAAHKHGIVHRDLKPLNIMLTKSGAKLLDFGLAKAATPAVTVGAGSTHATASAHLTGTGSILGTLHYMSPEQVEGREADTRSDIWSLGAVIYEMITGQLAFAGESSAAVVGAILKDRPLPLADKRPEVPPALDRLVACCFEKDPDERWQSASDVKRELAWVRTASPVDLSQQRSKMGWVARVAAAVAASVALGAVGFAASRWWSPSVEPRLVQLELTPPPGMVFNTSVRGGMTISPDGRAVAFVVSSGESSLWLRQLDSPIARELPHTSGAQVPFWSPDSKSVAFFAQGTLKKVDVAGGPPIVIAQTVDLRGGSWGAAGTILLAGASGGLSSVSASGGTPTAISTLDLGNGENSNRWPQFLPDGRRFLFFVRSRVPGRTGVYLSSLDHPNDKQLLMANTSAAAYSSPHGTIQQGRLLWVRDQTLMSQVFDPDSGRLGGEPMAVPSTEGIGVLVSTNRSMLSVSNEGTLAFSGATDLFQMAWFGRDGKVLGTVGTPERYSTLRISPDGASVAVSIADGKANRDIWKMDFQQGLPNRLTREGGNVPVWSPDGRRLASHDNARTRLFSFGAGGEDVQPLLESTHLTYVNDWSPDGRFLLFTEFLGNAGGDLWLLPTAGEHTPAPALVTPLGESHGQFSPDGHWMAYTSDESGKPEIYVTGVPAKVSTRISTNGGSYARWRKDGRELFYRSLDGKLMAVAVSLFQDRVEHATPVPLMDIIEPLGLFAYPYDVSPDGQKVLTLMPTDGGHNERPVTIMINWETALKR